MKYNEFEELLKRAELVAMNSNSASNWNKRGRVPDWVRSWVENYIKARKIDDIKSVICRDN